METDRKHTQTVHVQYRLLVNNYTDGNDVKHLKLIQLGIEGTNQWHGKSFLSFDLTYNELW